MRGRKKSFIVGLISTFLLAYSGAIAQYNQLDGVKICLDPGHGGHDSNDRPTELGIGVTYYESDANWEAIGNLDSLLQKLGANVKITKTTNDPDAEDREPSLSDRVQVANSFGADYFHSFHTNGSDNKTVNYTLVLYPGPEDGTADYPDALAMAEIMEVELFEYMRTTTHYARADIPFTGYTNGLGVLNNLSMPGTLSECSFHSNIDEGRRLMSSGYLKAAAWSLVKSFLAYYEAGDLGVGEIGGVVTDIEGNTLNGVTVTINSGLADEKIYVGDQYLNGFYFFDWLQPGDYEVTFEKFGFDAQVKNVSVVAGEYTEMDAALNAAGGAPSTPILSFISNPSSAGNGVSAGWVANAESTLLGYRLYYATDDTKENWALAADESTLTSETTFISIASSDDFIVAPAGDVFHFKLTSVAESGAESIGGDVYSRSSAVSGDKVLVVDGFDRTSGSYTEKQHVFAADYFISIRETRLAEVATATNEAVASDLLDLNNYDMVMWFLGDESTADESLSLDEQAKLKTYLENGGKLFVSGSEVAWDLDNKGSTEDQAFYANYMKSEYVGDGAVEYTPATGIAGTAFEGLSIPFGITYPEDYPDDIAPVTGATAIFDYAVTGKRGGVAYKGVFGSGSVSGGVVVISFPLETAAAADQMLVMKTVMDYLEVGDYFPISPAQPVLLQVSGSGSGVSATWVANSELSLLGYRLYYALSDDLSEWALAADEEMLDEKSTEIDLNDFTAFKTAPSGQVFHYRLTAVSEGGFESTASDVYSATNQNASTNLLIVDGFDRTSGSYTEVRHSFATNYFLGLMETGSVNIATAANEQIEAGAVDLSAYQAVFWILGDETSSGTTFSAAEQTAVKGYLENGGRLFVSGSEIGWDLYSKGDDADKSFYANYLKANFVSDGGAGQSPAKGISGTPFSDLQIEFGLTYPEDYPDQISANGGAIEILEYATSGKYAGVAYSGVFGDGVMPGSVVYLSFPLEGALQPDMDETLEEVMDYFGVLDPSAPHAEDDAASTTSDAAVLIDVLANDWDLNGDIDPSSIAIVSSPNNGTATVVDGKVNYESDAAFGGEETFTYQISDLAGQLSNVATVSVQVENVLAFIPTDEIQITLFPNPVKGAAVLDVTVSESDGGEWIVNIVDANGRLIKSETHILSFGEQQLALDTESLNQGLYLVQISNGLKTNVLKLIKE